MGVFADEYETLSDKELIKSISNEDFIKSYVDSLFKGINEIAYNETLKDDENIVKDQDVLNILFEKYFLYLDII